jgi:hypothetical protein
VQPCAGHSSYVVRLLIPSIHSHPWLAIHPFAGNFAA